MATFTTETEPIRIDTLGGPAADPKWKFTDAKGHEHRAYTETGTPTWPTLKWVVDETYWCEDCQDEHHEGHYECAICGETIEPGMIHKPPESKTIPGLTTRLINDIPVTDEIWEQARRIWEQAEADAETQINALIEPWR
mgnify:CR=1 FL=1